MLTTVLSAMTIYFPFMFFWRDGHATVNTLQQTTIHVWHCYQLEWFFIVTRLLSLNLIKQNFWNYRVISMGILNTFAHHKTMIKGILESAINLATAPF